MVKQTEVCVSFAMDEAQTEFSCRTLATAVFVRSRLPKQAEQHIQPTANQLIRGGGRGVMARIDWLDRGGAQPRITIVLLWSVRLVPQAQRTRTCMSIVLTDIEKIYGQFPLTRW